MVRGESIEYVELSLLRPLAGNGYDYETYRQEAGLFTFLARTRASLINI